MRRSVMNRRELITIWIAILVIVIFASNGSHDGFWEVTFIISLVTGALICTYRVEPGFTAKVFGTVATKAKQFKEKNQPVEPQKQSENTTATDQPE